MSLTLWSLFALLIIVGSVGLIRHSDRDINVRLMWVSIANFVGAAIVLSLLLH